MPPTPRRTAQRLLHLAVISSVVLTMLGPVSPPRSLAAAPEALRAAGL